MVSEQKNESVNEKEALDRLAVFFDRANASFRLRFGEVNSNMCCAILYVQSHLPFLKEHPKNVDSVITLIIDIINGLPSQRIKKQEEPNVLVLKLIRTLIDVADIFLQQYSQSTDKIDKILDQIRLAMNRFPDEFFQAITVTEKNAIAQFLSSKLSKPIKLEKQTIKSVSGIKLQYDSSSFIEEFIKKYRLKASEEFSQKRISWNLLVENLEEFSTYFTPVCEERMKMGEIPNILIPFDVFAFENNLQYDFTQLIKWLQSRFKDKTYFAKWFLWNLQENCEYNENHFHLFVLNNIWTMLVILDEPLGPHELSALIKSTNFKLPEPKGENLYCLYDYMMHICFGVGNQYKDIALNYEFFLSSYGDGNVNAELWKLFYRRAYAEYKPSSALEMATIPPMVQMDMVRYSAPVINNFQKVIIKIIKVNERALGEHKKEMLLFLMLHGQKILKLIELIGESSISIITNMIANTLLSLERVLNLIRPIPLPSQVAPILKEYFSKHRLPNMDFLMHFLIFLNGLTDLKIHIESSSMKLSSAGKLQKELPGDSTPEEFLRVLGSWVLKKILGKKDIFITKKEIDLLLDRIQPGRFAQLIAASNTMKDDAYREIYLELMELDLKGGGIRNFLHNTGEDNTPLGQQVAKHNQKIKKLLCSYGVDAKSALGYKKTYEFVLNFDNSSQLTVKNNLLVLWDYFQELKKRILPFEDKLSNLSAENSFALQLLEVFKKINKLEKTLEKYRTTVPQLNTNEAIVELLSKQHIHDELESIQRICMACDKAKEAAKQCLPGSSILEIFEFLDHIKSQKINLLKVSEKKGDDKNGNNRPSYFRVSQWDKAKADTFFLGDEVGCCLASTGARFSAMVQRRLDDAMLFHVVTDIHTGRPAALAWLYLAETDSNPSKLVLVANFFEVHTKYGVNDFVRKAILNSLLKFTYQFVKDHPGIDAFYMSELNYGWNRGDLENYPKQYIKMKDKLGGPFIPSSCHIPDGHAHDTYFLVSLKDSRFHQFNPGILARETPSRRIDLEFLLKQTIFQIMRTKKGRTADEILQFLIKNNRVWLERFFDLPLMDSIKLQQMVREIVSQGFPALNQNILWSNRTKNLEQQTEFDRSFGLIHIKKSDSSLVR